MTATTATTCCDRCGVHVGHRGRELDVGVDGAITVRRILCLRCLDYMLELVGAGMRLGKLNAGDLERLRRQ